MLHRKYLFVKLLFLEQTGCPQWEQDDKNADDEDARSVMKS